MMALGRSPVGSMIAFCVLEHNMVETKCLILWRLLEPIALAI